jgi:hypothetical protein
MKDSAQVGLPVSRACDLESVPDEQKWLIEELWAEQAVGILGGEPKCCKSFLALDMAVSVASGAPCLRQFAVSHTGPVLLFPAEDSLGVVRERLEGICQAAGARFEELPIYVITAPRLLLDVPQDQQRLRATVDAIRPALLVLDPFIRLHRADENASKEVAPILGYLRELQREFATAVLLVHHARKGSGKGRPGQALRGSSDLHGWGDSNLYLRRQAQGLSLSIEQRAAPSRNHVPLALVKDQDALALTVVDERVVSEPQTTSARERVIKTLTESQQPLSTQQLRKQCHMRTATLCETLALLAQQGHVTHGPQGYAITADPTPFLVSFPDDPIAPSGNGNGKPSRHAQLPLTLDHQLT